MCSHHEGSLVIFFGGLKNMFPTPQQKVTFFLKWQNEDFLFVVEATSLLVSREFDESYM